jgi:hypothetical protein
MGAQLNCNALYGASHECASKNNQHDQEALMTFLRNAFLAMISVAVCGSLLNGGSASVHSVNHTDESDYHQVRQIRLLRVATFGVLEPTRADTPADGRVFGAIARALESRTGELFVLDALSHKLVVLSPTGELRRVIAHRRGSGPGEFRYPTAMDIDEDRVAIYDYPLNRVTVFDAAGVAVQTLNVPRTKDIALIGNYLFGSHLPGRSHALWRIRLSDGGRDDLLPLADSSARFNPRGTIARISGYTGSLLVANGEPSTWYSGPLEQIRGRYALQRYDHQVRDGIPVPPGEPLSIMPLAGGTAVGVAYTEISFPSRQPPSLSARWLDIYDRNGRLIARGQLPDATVTSITATQDGRSLLLGMIEPFLSL